MSLDSGFLPRTLTSAMIVQRSMVPEDAEAIARLFEYLKTAMPTMAEIKSVVCEFYRVSSDEIEGDSRIVDVVFARHVFCFLANRYCRVSLNQIGRRCGHVDHSTVHHAIRRIERFAVSRPLVRDDLDLLRLRICEKLLLRKSRGTA
jgi:chromosomal replication initiation ATPase DnaA